MKARSSRSTFWPACKTSDAIGSWSISLDRPVWLAMAVLVMCTSPLRRRRRGVRLVLLFGAIRQSGPKLGHLDHLVPNGRAARRFG
jgi:hypothetical protein